MCFYYINSTQVCIHSPIHSHDPILPISVANGAALLSPVYDISDYWIMLCTKCEIAAYKNVI